MTSKTTKATKPVVTKSQDKAMKVVTMSELYTSEAAIKKASASVYTRGRTLQRDVHKIACSVLMHIEQHNDVRMAANILVLFEALPKAYRTNALRDWFAAYGPIAWENNKAKFVKDKPVELAKALLDPFWEFAPEPAYVPLDIAKFIDMAVKKVMKDQKETGKNHGKVIAALEAAKTVEA